MHLLTAMLVQSKTASDYCACIEIIWEAEATISKTYYQT